MEERETIQRGGDQQSMASDKEIVDTRLVGSVTDEMHEMIDDFVRTCNPVDAMPLLVVQDKATGAHFIEAHIPAQKLVATATIDVPLDPDEQAEYRANRGVLEDHSAFARMKEDANNSRTFSNLVGEFNRTFDELHPLKIIGGQHRFTAIQDALANGVDEHHGVKIYFGLDAEQRLDVQLISNTNIEVSTDLFDRMTETLAGPQLRRWCQEVGLLEDGQDFADRRAHGNPITVRAARTFIINYFNGAKVEPKKFDSTETTPTVIRSGVQVEEWDQLKATHRDLWKNENLKLAGIEFSRLVESQRASYQPSTGKQKPSQRDFAEKALNYAVLSSWALIAGVLSNNKARQKRHFALRKSVAKDPLNAAALAKGRHKSDPENYRGLGYRTDAKERSRFAELFFLQAEDGSKITPAKIDLAIKKSVAKDAQLDALRAAEKAKS